MLACSIGGATSNSTVMLTRLPTLTRTPLPSLTPTASSPPVAVAVAAHTVEAMPPTPVSPPVSTSASSDETATNQDAPSTTESVSSPSPNPPTVTATEPPPSTNTATATATGTPSVTSTPTPTATETPRPTHTPSPTPFRSGWVFNNVRTAPDLDNSNLLVYGELLNDTGTAQELDLITGTFYNAQGKVIADENTSDEWPFDVIPQGGQMPFRLTVPGIQSAADFDLRVEAGPSSEIIRQDFRFADFKPSIAAGDFCFTGQLQTPGSELQSYLMIVAVLYDQQDNVINFSVQENPGDEDPIEFEVCVETLKQSVARFDLRAWGQ